MKKIIALSLALIMLLTLCACGKGEDKTEESAEPSQTASGEKAESYGYTELSLPSGNEGDSVIKLYASKDKLYVICAAETEESAEYSIYSMNHDGSEPFALQTANAIYDMAIDKDGNIWSIWAEDGSICLSCYSPEGELLKEFTELDMIASGLYPAGINVVDGDIVYITAYNEEKTTVYALDFDGKLDHELPLNGMPLGVVTTAEGRMGICAYDMAAIANDSMDFELKLADPESKSWSGDSISVGIPQGGMYGGLSYSFYTNDTADLFGHNAETGEKEIILNWVDSGLSPSAVYLAELPEGGFAVAIGELNISEMSYSFSLGILTPGGEGGDEREVLTLSTLIPDTTISAAVTKFNKENSDYKIEIKTYLSLTDAVDQQSIEDALLQFNTDIITGNIPDLINMMNMSTDLYASKGILEDLYTYLDADPDINRDDYFENVLEAFSINGKLPYITDGIYVYTLMGDSDYIGDGTSITAEELNQIFEDNQEMTYPLGDSLTKENFLTNILYGNMGLINWETGECFFDTPEFIALLELSNKMPDVAGEMDGANLSAQLESSLKIADGTQVAALESILAVEQIASYYRNLGDKLNIIGFPANGEACHVVDAMLKLGISSQSEHKEAAWSFIRIIIDDKTGGGNNMIIPVSRKAFDEKMNAAIDGGESIFGMFYPDMEIVQEDADALKALVESANYSASYDQVIMDIVTDQAAEFFAGGATAEQVATIIQSRIQTYVNEQR